MSNTVLRSIESAAAPRPSRAPLFAVVGLATVVGLAAGAWFVLRPLPVQPRPDPVLVVIDAGTAAVPDAAIAMVAEPEIDAGVAVAARVDAGLAVVVAKNGRLELRIRPYATVFLDDRKLGDTPLPAISVPVGKHKLRLVNPAFGKDVELNIVIKPGENVVKHNLKE